jgi:predicted nucleic acid-binding Zn ribbon protein
MARRTPRPLSKSIAALADQLAPRTTLADAQRAWPSAAGAAMAKYASPTGERGGTLTITCRSSVWAQELDLMAPELIAKLNGLIGEGRITALRCVASPSRSWASAET